VQFKCRTAYQLQGEDAIADKTLKQKVKVLYNSIYFIDLIKNNS
jgi:hypothetical protein